jgi:putative phage-type endonuclease
MEEPQADSKKSKNENMRVKRIAAPWDKEHVYAELQQWQEGDMIYRRLARVEPASWYIHPRVQELLQLGYFKQRTLEWKQSRQLKITASKVANIIRDDRCKSKENAFLEEVGVTPKFEGNKYTQHGMTYEPHAIKFYMAKTQHLGFDFGLILHPQYEFLGGSPDLIRDDGVLIEIKCPYNRQEKRIANLKRNIIPSQYMCQVQMLLEITGLEVAHYVEFYPPLHGWPIEMYVVHVNRDRAWFATHLPKMQAFHARLVNFVTQKAHLVRQQTLWKFKYRLSNSWKDLLVAYLYHVRYLRHMKATKAERGERASTRRYANLSTHNLHANCLQSVAVPPFKKTLFSPGSPSDAPDWRKKAPPVMEEVAME